MANTDPKLTNATPTADIATYEGPEREVTDAEYFEEGRLYEIDDRKRILTFMGAIYGIVVGSMTYILSVIGHKVKSYGLSQSDLTTISSVGKIIAYTSFYFGWIFDYVGPLPLLLFSTVSVTSGLLLMGLTFDGIIPSHTWLFVVYFTLITMAAASVDVACMLSTNLTLPMNRGDVICCAKIISALASSFMGLYYASLFQGNYAHFMYFASAVGLAAGTFAMINVKLPRYIVPGIVKRRLTESQIKQRKATQVAYDSHPAPRGNIVVAHVIVLTSLTYLTIISVLLSLGTLTQTTRYILAAVATLCFASFALMLLPPRLYQRIGSLLPKCRRNKRPADAPGSIIVVNSVKQRVPMTSPSYRQSFWRDLLTLRLWAFLWVTFSTLGIGFTISFNSPQIYQALANFSDVGNARNAVVIGIGSATGRYFVGTMERLFMSRRGYTKYYVGILLALSPFIMSIGVILFMTLRDENLTVSWFFDALGFGMAWGMTPIMTTMMYTHYAGKVYISNFTAVAICLAVVNKGMFGTLFDKGMEGKEPGSKCFECLRTTLIVCLCITVSGTLAACYVFYDYRKLILKETLVTDAEYEDAISKDFKKEPLSASSSEESKSSNQNHEKQNDK